MQSIRLDGCQVTCSGLKGIGNWCVSLKELSLSKCSGVTDDGLSSIVKKHTDLKKLDITCCRKITQISIAHVTKSCGSLVSLKMESCTLVPFEAFFLIGQNCHFLEELDLTDNDVDDEGMVFHLHIGFCIHGNAQNCKCCNFHETYQNGNGKWCFFVCVGLKFISKCSQLSVLKLGICMNISDEGLISVGNGCPKLKELDLYRFAKRNTHLYFTSLVIIYPH